jgi:hypothetical protein
MDARARRLFRTFMVGSAVAASLAALEAANDPVLAATGLTTSPSVEESGSSPEVTLTWMTALSPSTTITVNVGGFNSAADPSDCRSSGITVQIAGTTSALTGCTWNSVSKTFTLTAPAVGATRLTFPAGVLVAGAPGSTQISLNDDIINPNIKSYATMTITPSSGPNPPDWFQSYQRGAVAENCAPTWNPSWAMWANNGTGGYVCVRTQYYDPALAAWSYR